MRNLDNHIGITDVTSTSLVLYDVCDPSICYQCGVGGAIRVQIGGYNKNKKLVYTTLFDTTALDRFYLAFGAFNNATFTSFYFVKRLSYKPSKHQPWVTLRRSVKA